jgi:anti-anti-sigma factor
MKTGKGTGEVVLLRLSAYGDMPAFVTRIDGLVESGIVRFVLDLDSVAIVNSTLLGFFVKTRNALREREGDLVLARPADFVMKTMRALGLDELFTIQPDLEGAVRHLWQGHG